MKSLSKATFSDHLEQLRQIMIQICLILFIALAICFTFHHTLLNWLLRPITTPLVTLSPLEGFSVCLKVSFYSALVLSAPLWLLCVIRFIKPALHTAESRLLLVLLFFSLLFIGGATTFAYQFTLPAALNFLSHFQPHGSLPYWSLAKTCDLILWLYFGHTLAALCVVTLFLLVHLQLIPHLSLIRHRKKVIVVVFILAAILTPPDVLTQCLLALPLLGCYELAILYARIRLVFNLSS